MRLARTPTFWIGAFALLSLMFAWSDSLRHIRSWAWSRSAGSGTEVIHGGGEISFSHRHIEARLRTGESPFTQTPIYGAIRSSKRDGNFRVGALHGEIEFVDGTKLHPPLLYQSRSAVLTLPHWLLAAAFIPIWFTASAWRAAIFNRRHNDTLARTRSPSIR